ncbi:MAG: glycosyltransferase [Gemmatimonadota bacterium]|nr:glycosyltransferase [Gemmatimonadota bacterium]
MTRRVLLLSTSLGMGGADRQILYLARALLANDFEVRLVSMTPLEEMGRQAVIEGLPVISLDMQRGQADWRSFQRFVAVLRDWQPHLLTSFMYHANLLGRLAGRFAGVPLIVTSIRSEQNGSAARDWLMRLTNWMDDCCTTNSEQVAESLRRRRLLPGGKSRVIPNGVDTAALTSSAQDRERIRKDLGLSPRDFLWLAVGRLWDQKDYPTMLEAFQPLATAPAYLAIAGRGPLLDELRLRTQQLGIASQVKFLGVRHDILALLSAADGFVLSSAWEGMPNVVMEALAAAVPVVATRVGGVPELVESGQSGFLAPPRDSAALSQAMRELMSRSRDEQEQMGRHGRDHIAAQYGMQAMANRWIGLFEELLKQKGVSASLPLGAGNVTKEVEVAEPHV